MQDPRFLYSSDDPETFTAHGKLFRAPLPTDGTVARLLFDHVNGAGMPLRVIAGIFNLDNANGNVDTFGVTGGPYPNGMASGHAATQAFLALKTANPATIPTTTAIAGGGSLILYNQVLAAGSCITGLFDIDCGSAGLSYEVRVFACDPNSGIDVWDALPETVVSVHQRRGVFDMTQSAALETFTYVGQPVSFEIGSVTALLPRASLDWEGGALYKGEYGVLKRFSLVIPAQTNIWLYQSARGLAATASYIISGKMYASHQFAPSGREKVAPLSATGSSTTISFLTMPEINSSYPVQFSLDVDDATLADPGTLPNPVYAVT